MGFREFEFRQGVEIIFIRSNSTRKRVELGSLGAVEYDTKEDNITRESSRRQIDIGLRYECCEIPMVVRRAC